MLALGFAGLTVIAVLAGLLAAGTAAIGWRLGMRHAARTQAPLDRYLLDAVRDFPYGMAVFDAEDRLLFCNDRHRSINPLAHPFMVPGRAFEEILRDAVATRSHMLEGKTLEAFTAERLAAHKNPSNKPFLQHLRSGRWIQIRETRTGLGGTLTTWNDVTPLKLREQALAILAERSPSAQSLFETAAEALATGLGCRMAGIAWYVGEDRACLEVLWDGGLTGKRFEYALAGTPCQEAKTGTDYCHIPEGVAERYPNDELLRQAGIVSFVGHVIHDAEGRVSGHVFACDDRPMGNEPWRRETIELIARWVEIAFNEQRARDAAEEHAQRWQDVAELAADWIWETGPDLRFTLVSERVTEVLGVEPADMLGLTREELFSGNPDDPAWETHLVSLQAREAFRNFQYTFEPGDGTVRHVRISGKPVHDKHGAFKGYRGTGTDVTPEVTARAEKMKTLQMLEAVFENLPDGISLADADLKLTAINKRFLELLGFPPERFKSGDPFEKFIRYNAERGEYGPGDPDELVRTRVELAKRFEPHCIERTRPDGRTLEIRGNPLPGGGFVTTYSDVSDRVQAEQAQRSAKEAAEYANRTKSEFLATISHELRTPLNAIIGFSEILSREMFGPLGNPSYRGYADDIHGSGIHLLGIINDILDLSKAEAGRIELSETEVNLCEVIDSALRLMRPHAEAKSLEIRLELPAPAVLITADELRLRQVLLNLLSNAVKFTKRGSVTLRVEAEPARGVTIEILDTGVGIAQHELDRIFEPFAQVESTLSRTSEGTGLGLPLSRRLIHLLGGTLTVQSAPGQGSVATVWLPPERLLSKVSVA